jgi:hypothetical protein
MSEHNYTVRSRRGVPERHSKDNRQHGGGKYQSRAHISAMGHRQNRASNRPRPAVAGHQR